MNAYALEWELADLIVDVLGLEGTEPDQIRADAPLFRAEGVGLDSLDALELAVAVSRIYGIHLHSEGSNQEDVMYSLSTLARHIARQQRRGLNESLHQLLAHADFPERIAWGLRSHKIEQHL